jgi:hypothetical protein
MSYNTMVKMANDEALRARVVACAAKEGVADPNQWAADNMWKLVIDDGWIASYDYALGLNATALAGSNPVNLIDPGYADSVIDDAAILSVVQPRVLAGAA